MFCKIFLWNHLVQGFCVLGDFLITALILWALISLFRFSASSSVSFGRLYFSRNVSISPRFSNVLACSCSSYFLTILCISVESVVISPLSFLILFIWVLSLFFFISLVKGLSILFIVSKNHLLVSLIFCIFLDSLFLLWSLLFPFFYSLWALFVILILSD